MQNISNIFYLELLLCKNFGNSYDLNRVIINLVKNLFNEHYEKKLCIVK